jgi:hypothetical protein
VASDPSGDLTLTPLGGQGRTVREWLTNFHLTLVCIDPYTNESSWILDTAARFMRHFSGSAARMCWLVAGDAEAAHSFLGPLAKEFLTFTDPDRAMITSLGLATMPSIVFLKADGTIGAVAEGWHPQQWKAVAEKMATVMAWSKPDLPHPKDPRPYDGVAAKVA